MRALGILCLAIAASLGLATQLVPDHALLERIELATQGIPGDIHPALLVAIVGAVLMLFSPRRWKPAAPSGPPPIRSVTSPASQSAVTSEEPESDESQESADLAEWKERVLEAMSELQLEKGVSLHIDRKQGVPFTLILERCTPGRTRRSLDQLGRFLGPLPTPPRVAILFRECEAANVAWQHLVSGALHPYIGRDSSRVVSQPDRVDLIFHSPDPCYSSDSAE